MKKQRVVAAMSGGVDSCVAAALLLEQGYEVVGITMQLWNHGQEGNERFGSCCSLSDVHDARIAAHRLGIPHYVVNYEKEFKKGVVDYFASEYDAGRTPNPCVMCNSKLKFDHLADRAHALGADMVATGHFARVKHFEDGRPSQLFKGTDPKKDQSYFLFDVKPEYLKRAIFPLGEMTKPEVRKIAAGMGIHTAEKHESQEICFVSGRRYTEFLDKHYPEVTVHKGDIVDRDGNVLGQHDGIHMFTVGQRKGLGNIPTIEPKYVAAIDAKTNRVIIDDMENLAVAAFEVGSTNWFDSEEDLPEERVLSVMVRYRAPVVSCRVKKVGERKWMVMLAEKARWITPGQAAVFYDGDRVVGGGFIATPEFAEKPVQRAHAEVSASL